MHGGDAVRVSLARVQLPGCLRQLLSEPHPDSRGEEAGHVPLGQTHVLLPFPRLRQNAPATGRWNRFEAAFSRAVNSATLSIREEQQLGGDGSGGEVIAERDIDLRTRFATVEIQSNSLGKVAHEPGLTELDSDWCPGNRRPISSGTCSRAPSQPVGRTKALPLWRRPGQ